MIIFVLNKIGLVLNTTGIDLSVTVFVVIIANFLKKYCIRLRYELYCSKYDLMFGLDLS